MSGATPQEIATAVAAAVAAAPGSPPGPPRGMNKPFAASGGRAEARTWLKAVCMLASAQRWAEDKTVAWACAQMEGTALDWMCSLSPRTCQDWTAWRAAFEQRFCPALPADVAFARLRERRREAGESLRGFAAALQALAADLPSAPSDAEMLAHFMAGLDRDTRRALRLARVTSIPTALAHLALLGEDDEAGAVVAQVRRDESAEIRQALAELQRSFAELAHRGRADDRRGQQKKSSQSRSRACYACGSTRHLCNSCPYKRETEERRRKDEEERGSASRSKQVSAVRDTTPELTSVLTEILGQLQDLKGKPADSTSPMEPVCVVEGKGSKSTLSWPLRVHAAPSSPPVRLAALVDTGAQVTLIRAGLLSERDVDAEARRPRLQGAGGTKLDAVGMAELDLVTETARLSCSAVVVRGLAADMILGMDFLHQHVRRLDLVEGTAELTGGQTVRLHAGPRATPLQLAADVHLGPGESCWVRCVGARNHLVYRPVGAGEDLLPQAFQLGREGALLSNPSPVAVSLESGTTVAEVATDVLAVLPTTAHVASTERPNDKPPSWKDVRLGDSLPADVRRRLEGVLRRRAKLFAPRIPYRGNPGLPEMEVITEGPPVRQRLRRLSAREADIVDQELDSMLRMGVVRPSSSPWASPLVLVRKKDDTVRFCVDFRALNKRTQLDTYPLPRADEVLASMAGARWFSCFDLAKGYWQVPLAKSARPKTAFTTHRGLYEFVVMPFGLTNAPSAFQRMMDAILGDLVGRVAHVYLDDIIVFSATAEEHAEHVRLVLDRLAEFNLVLKATKSVVGVQESRFLGHVVSAKGLAVDGKKVAALRAMPVPYDRTSLRRFLGLANYYRAFVPGFATLAAPLHHLLKSDSAWEWGTVQEDARQALINCLATAPVLAHPQPRQPFVLYTDASGVGLGAVVEQEVDGKARPVAFASRSLSGAEKNYTVTEQECLAVVWAMRQFRHWFDGVHVQVFTDHAALKYLLTTSHPESHRLQRWVAFLSEFSITVQHRPGRLMTVPDTLSRAPLSSTGEAPVPEPSGLDWPVSRMSEAPRLGAPAPPEFAGAVLPVAGQPGPPLQLRWRRQAKPAHDTAAELVGPASTPPPKGEAAPRDDRCASPPQLGAPRRGAEDGHNGDRAAWGVADLAGIDWVEAQAADRETVAMRAWLEGTGEPPATVSAHIRKHAVLEGGLVRVVVGDSSRILVPHGVRQRVLAAAHGDRLGGHHGQKRTAWRLAQGFTWPRWFEDVVAYVASCDTCQRDSGRPRRVVGERGALDDHRRWGTVAVDMAGPLPVTQRGNRFFLLAVDHLSRYVITRAIPTATAAEVRRFWIEDVVGRHGPPARMLTDRGSNFLAADVQRLVEALGTKKVTTTAYNPQGDARAERQIRSVKQHLRRTATSAGCEWDEALPWATLAVNSTPSSATGLTPYVVMHGHQGRLVPGAGAATTLEGPKPGESFARAAARQAVEAVRHAVAQAAAQAHGRQEGTSRQELECGDLALVWQPKGGFAKGDWVGPLLVLRRKPGGVLELQDMAGGPVLRVNQRRVREYTERDELRAPPSEGVRLAAGAAAGLGEDVVAS